MKGSVLRRPSLRAVLAGLAGLGLLVTGAPSVAAGEKHRPSARPGVSGTPFSEGGSWIYHYVDQPEAFEFAGQIWDYDPTPYSKIANRLNAGYYTSRGITNLMIYAPYRSTGEFRGLPAIDYFDSNPENGSIEDFRRMVAAANRRGITVTMFVAMTYISPLNPIFIKAQEDRRDGVRSPERDMIRWDERDPEGSIPPSQGGRPPSGADVPRPFEGGWEYSEIADRWYATSWELPALDFDSKVTREYAKDVLRFWMDLGVQGFEYDAPASYWGMQGADEPRQTDVMISTPRRHRPDLELYLHAEGFGTFGNQAYNDRVGYTHVLINGDDDFDSFASRVGRIPQTLTPDQLEDHWATYFDPRQANGRGVYSWSLYDYDVDPRLRALDAAVQAGMGAQYSIDNEHLVDNPKNEVLPEEALELTWDVHRALRNSPALSPSASRERVQTQTDTRAYSVLRRSADRRHAALNVYNFSPDRKCVTVNLAGTGITVPQRTVDLATGRPGPWLWSTTPTIKLPGYGYRFLAVEAGRGFPWTVVDDADRGWTFGGGWSRIEDPSAYRGTRIGGSQQGGFAEYRFPGRTIQGWGRKGTAAAQRVEVFVDGVSHGIHSQRRTAPVPGAPGTAFYGQQLFSITGLKPGKHTLLIRQASDQHAGIDYLRSSHERFTPARPLPGGDRCGG